MHKVMFGFNALAVASAGIVWAAGGGSIATTQTLTPAWDGTVVDGGVYGAFDGDPDGHDYYFNGSSYEGAITLSRDTPQWSIEHRVFWEYDLSRVTLTPPVRAMLTFSLRGTPVMMAPDAEVFVYSYPADLRESESDFLAGPAEFQGYAVVAPYEEPPPFTVDVSLVVNRARLDGTNAVAFRFQINPHTSHTQSQAFVDANEDDQTTKPVLTLEDVVPGDANGDRVVDALDAAQFVTCMDGPDIRADSGCAALDLDADNDVDQRDFASFQRFFGF